MTKTYSFHGIKIQIKSGNAFPFKCFEDIFKITPAKTKAKNHLKLIFEDRLKPVKVKIKTGIKAISLRRERNLHGFYDGKKLYLSDSKSKLEVNYSKATAKFHLHNSILQHPKLFTHTLLPLALVELLKKHGFYYLHASCADIAGKGILFIGGPGAGKTTACYSLMKKGASWVSDDAVLIKKASGKIRAYSFIKEFSMKTGKKALFTELKRIRSNISAKVDLHKRGFLFSSFKKSTVPKVLVYINEEKSLPGIFHKIKTSDVIGKIIRENEFLLIEPAQAGEIIDTLGLLCRQSVCYGMGKRSIILRPRVFFSKIAQFLR